MKEVLLAGDVGGGDHRHAKAQGARKERPDGGEVLLRVCAVDVVVLIERRRQAEGGVEAGDAGHEGEGQRAGRGSERRAGELGPFRGGDGQRVGRVVGEERALQDRRAVHVEIVA